MEISVNGVAKMIHRPRLSHAQAVGLAGFEYDPGYVVVVTVNGGEPIVLHENEATTFLTSDTVVVAV